ncbi:MAG: hypothetical protein HY247_03105 [archaeon]|nr:MAG: hypothetical protein HY247_03105 [archaeon]
MGKDDLPGSPIEIDSEAGVIQEKPLESRVMTISAQGWANVKVELDSTFMSGAAIIMQRMGYSYGRYIARIAKQKAQKTKKEVNSKSVFQVILDAAKAHGWGQFSLNSGNFETGVASIVVKDCFFCLFDKKGTVPRCNYLVGVVGGVADELTGFSHRVGEGRCAAKDDGLCEVKVERVTAAS